MNISLHTYSCPFVPWKPADGRLFDAFAYDTETTDIDPHRPYLTPSYVLGAACDGRHGVFIARDHLLAFFQAHQGVPFIMHNAAFDLRVTDAVLQPHYQIYTNVENLLVWDTLILRRLFALATRGNTARGEAKLADCCRIHLGFDLNKTQTDGKGQIVRTSFGQFLGLPPRSIPTDYLTYLGRDALATWHLYHELRQRIDAVLRNASSVWGYVNDAWLQSVIQRFGPLTHHVQLKASILTDALHATGIGLDPQRCDAKAHTVTEVLHACRERMRQRGFLAGAPGSAKTMQTLLTDLKRHNPDLELKTTPSGKWSTAEEDLAELMARDPFFADYVTYKTSEKLLSTYLRKMSISRLYPRFGYLLESGRTFCSGGFNLQNLPREKDEQSATHTIRGCFVPDPGQVFIDSDFSQIELVVLAHVLQHQFGYPSRLVDLINSGQDVHYLLAATMLNKPPTAISKAERNSVKPVSFGRPGGMGVRGLQRVAKNGYGIDLTDAEVEERIRAYHQLCPELDRFLTDEIDTGDVIARTLHLTPAAYYAACGYRFDPHDPANHIPAGWLGGMLLKVLSDPQPITKRGTGRPYTPDEMAFFWTRAQDLPLPLQPPLAAKLRTHQAHRDLYDATRNWAGRRPVFTYTGRLRAQTTFCSSRNTVFQGAAADGAILALWRVWRAGYQLVDFVHDQLVVESPADHRVLDRAADIERLMKEGMAEVVPGMLVKVETVITQSLNKDDLDPRYQQAPNVCSVLTPATETANHATYALAV